jgi:PAS domain S-box-containing protein
VDGLYERLLEFTRDGVYRYTFDDGRILLANQGLVDILDLDCTPAELASRCLKDVLVYTEREGTVRHALERDGEIHNYEYHFQTLKGEDKWVIHDSFIVDDPETGVRVVEAIVKDITFRKRAERALAAEKERLSVTLRSIGDGVIATDREGVVTDLNRAAEQLTGWTETEAVGRPLRDVFDIVNEDTREPCASPVEKVIEIGHVVGLANHTALIARDGTERLITDSGAPIHNAAGEVIGVVLVFRDVTERRRMEQQVLRSERLAAIGRLAGGVSHDLRNPLAAIQNGVYFLRMVLEDPDATVAETLDILERELSRAERIISSLLDFARPAPPEREPTSVPDVVRAVLDRQEVPDKVEIALDLDDAPAQIFADPAQLDQVFSNLILNALQAMPDGGRLTVTCRHDDGGGAVVLFADTGEGIDARHRDQLFEPLFTTKRNGIGFGLSVTKTLIEGHGGRIEVESEPGNGSTFTVQLPGGAEGEREGP